MLFVLGYEMYPDITGGMEVFNYHLIETLQEDAVVWYCCGRDLGFPSAHHLLIRGTRPQKILIPLQVFFHLCRHREINSVVFSYSEASWVVWWLYTLITKFLHLKSTIVIHFGNPFTGSSRRILKAFFHSAANVIAVSEDIKRNYDAAFGLDCRVLYPAIPFRTSCSDSMALRKKWGIGSDSFVISMVGSLKDMKNPDTLLNAISGLSRQEVGRMQPVVLYAGDGPMMDSLESQASSIDAQVVFLGRLPHERIADVMACSDCYVIASDFEGTSLSLMEAMFNGVPIVASDVPGLNDMILDGINGLLFPLRNPVELMKCILRLFSDPVLSRKMGENAIRTFHERYDFRTIADHYLELI